MVRVHLSPPSAKARLLDSRISNYASVGEQGSAKARGDDPRISIYASRGRHQPVEPAANTPLTLLGQKELAKLIVVALKRSADSQATFYDAKVKEVGKRSCLRIREYREVGTGRKTMGNVH